MTIYKITTEGGTMYVSAKLAEASAPIHAYFGTDPKYDEDPTADADIDGSRWSPTPYQTADCQHRENLMAKLIADYCDMGEVLSVEVA
jgi:hypothetical protein